MRRFQVFLLMAAVLVGHAPAASAQGSREPRYKDVKALGGKTSFYVKRPLTDSASLKAMADTPRMERDITVVLTEAGVRNAAEVARDMLGVMRSQLTARRGGSCTTESAGEGELVECAFPVGGTMPFSAYRPAGAPHALKNFRWAGTAPFDAFMFRVYSRGTTYTVIVPKACGNLGLLPQTPPEVRVSKVAKESRVAAGNPVTFTINVSNAAPNGSAAARNVVVEDTLPAAEGLNWTLASVDPNCTLAGGRLTCRYAQLAPADFKSITVTSATPVPFSACQVLQNTATAASDNAAPARGSDTSTCVPPVLKVVKGPKNGTFTIGHAATFTIAVTNDAPAGASSATNVVLTDALPTTGGLEWQAATSTRGTCDAIAGGSLRCAIGTLAPAETATVTVTSRPAPLASCQAITNTARVNADGGIAGTDSATLTCTPAKLAVEKTPDGGTFRQGEQVTFSIAVRNVAPAGASEATSVKLTDVLPTEGGLSWDSAAASAGTCSLSGEKKATLACELGAIAPGQAVTITVKSPAKTPMGACQLQTNAAARATADGGLTAEDAGSLTCERSFWFFGDIFGGKDRRVRPIAGVNRLDGTPVQSNAGAGLDFAQCSPLVGLNLGVGKRLKNNWELAATAGLAMSVVQADHKVREHEATLDVEANKYLANGMFVGTGLSMWDLFHSDTLEPSLLTHFGVPLGKHPTHPLYFVGEGRLFFRQLDDVANNYQFWGGLRVHF